MYEVDDKDTVVRLKDIPESCGGAPLPHVVADEGHLVVAFYLQNTPCWLGRNIGYRSGSGVRRRAGGTCDIRPSHS